jgi:hypothetical protein
MKTQRKESGQIIVLFVLGLMALLALTGLAIDGAMLYSTRRYDQGVADSSAMAGASQAAQKMDNLHVNTQNFNCNSANLTQVIQSAKDGAKERAATNHFTLDEDISDQLGVTVTCGSQNTGAYIEYYLDVKVMISSEVQTALIQLFWAGTPRTTVEAVSRIRPRTALAHGYGITTTSTECNGNAANPAGVVFNGGINVYINGSGIFSNSCMQPSNGEVCTGVIPEGMTFSSDEERHAYICAHPGGIANVYTSGSAPCSSPSNCNISPMPQPATAGLPPMSVPPPDCASLGAHKTQKGSGTIGPGNYDEITVNNGTLTLNPGLYCIYGKGVSMKGEVTGIGVTFYLVNADFNISAGGEVSLTSPNLIAPPSIKGMLIYMAPGYAGSIDLGGNSGSEFLGTVFAPDGIIKVHGTPGATPTFNTELIASGVSINGNAVIDINYRENDLYSIPPQLDLFQ